MEIFESGVKQGDAEQLIWIDMLAPAALLILKYCIVSIWKHQTQRISKRKSLKLFPPELLNK